MRKALIFILVLLGAVDTLAQPTVEFADSLRQLYKVPELSYAVITDEQTLEIAALGRHSVNLRDTASLEDRFHLGSNTKALTAFIIAKYVEKGKLSWQTRFFDLFPEWQESSNQAYENISLEDLLSHRAGIQPFQGENDPEIPNFTGTNAERRKLFARFVLTLPPVLPDSLHSFIYSNAGYTLATLMLEKVTGKTWEYLVDKVFNKDLKLGVKISWPENQHHKDTWGHIDQNDTLIPVPSNNDYHLDYTEPAGDLNIKLKDYIRFIQLNLQGLEGKNNYLSAKTYQFIHNAGEDYALGWFNIHEEGKQLSVHAGTGAFTYFTIAQINRSDNVAYIIFTNSFNQNTQEAVRLLMRKLKARYGG